MNNDGVPPPSPFCHGVHRARQWCLRSVPGRRLHSRTARNHNEQECICCLSKTIIPPPPPRRSSPACRPWRTNRTPAMVHQYCDAAANKIRKACDAAQADVWFLVGGTQTNQTVLSAITPQYAGVVCPESAHINTHEAGAIEATGHKVLALPPARRQDHRRTARRILSELRKRPQP